MGRVPLKLASVLTQIIKTAWCTLNPSSKYRRHVVVTSLTSIGLYGVGILTGPILARSLGPSGRGDIAAVVAPASVLALALTIGLPTAAAYFVDTVAEEQLLLTAALFGLLLGVPVCALAWFGAPVYLSDHAPATITWARWLLLLIPFSVGTSAAVEIRRRVNPATWNYWRSVPVIVPGLGTIVLAVLGRLTLGSVLALYFVGQALQLVLLVSRLRERRPWKRPSVATFRLMFPYAWRSSTTSTATALTMRLDQVVLVAAVPPAELGLYAVAVMVASMTNPLTSGLSFALFGHLRGETDESRALSRFRRSAWTTLLVSSVAALSLGLLAVPLLRTAFGSDFVEGATALRLLLPGSVAFDLLGVLNAKLLSDGRPGEASWAALVGITITVLGLFLVVPHLGVEGAAIVTSTAFISEVLFLASRGALGASPGTSNASGTFAISPMDPSGLGTGGVTSAREQLDRSDQTDQS